MSYIYMVDMIKGDNETFHTISHSLIGDRTAWSEIS